MVDASAVLGRRIVEATRLAVAMHLGLGANEMLGQQGRTGGAGYRLATDGELSQIGDRLCRPPEIAEGAAE